MVPTYAVVVIKAVLPKATMPRRYRRIKYIFITKRSAELNICCDVAIKYNMRLQTFREKIRTE